MRMSVHLQELIQAKKVLLLQGPMGDYFTKVAGWLKKNNIECYKLVLNGGDWFFSYRLNNLHYRGKLAFFEDWLIETIKSYQLDTLICFGDCRFYHRVAKKVATELGLKFYVFEEGYIRPNYITFEKEGVNDFSCFKSYYQLADKTIPDLPLPDNPEVVGSSFSGLIRIAITYYLCWVFCYFLYPHYKHHRMISPISEVYYWLKSGLQRIINFQREPYKFLNLIQHHTDRYFIVALQVHNDSQVRVHSDYADVKDFIEEVIASFALHADRSHHLVLKHHPMDRGYRNYSGYIRELSARYGLRGRTHYMCDVHFPTLMKHSLGVVTINSTTGIQALHHGKPVIALGRAIYNLPKLTYQGALDHFWEHPGRVNRLHYRRFRYALVHYSQLNGSYYGQSPWMLRQWKVKPQNSLTQHQSIKDSV